ncbi:MAG: hypothetical protein KUG79_18735, partial [Pseudomonadales bacterium]|nr:hypothetical protein [Pseudomonadales bacterium]
MIKRLTLVFITLVALGASNCFSLGLGQLELKSALNQQFYAVIELTGVRGLENNEIIPNLGSQQDFDRVGVERNYVLIDLRFKVLSQQDGRMTVEVTSSKPIVEPFLNFIVEVLWPSGRLLREYTVLLDPPIFGQTGVEPVRASISDPRDQKAKDPTRQTTRQSGSVSPVAPSPSKSSSSSDNRSTQVNQNQAQRTNDGIKKSASLLAGNNGQLKRDEYGVTGSGDTLWKIALEVRPDRSFSVQQTMLAIQRANPEAFINNNINRLKAGYVLRIPDGPEIRRATFNAALSEVAIQNEAFADYKSGAGVAQLDASKRQPVIEKIANNKVEGELKLLAANNSTGDTAGSGSDNRSLALENDLAVAAEDLDRARRANTELTSGLDNLREQLDSLNEILTMKDDQLAALQAEIIKMEARAALEPADAQSPGKGSGSILTDPIFLGFILLLVIVIVLSVLFIVRRRQQEQQSDVEAEEQYVEIVEDVEPEAELEEEPAEIEAEEDYEEVTQQTSDVISEVEIYIAYGRFQQAITFLQNAIEAEPDRSDIQLKLLEVFVQTEDSVAFNLQFEQLRLLGDDQSIERGLLLQKKIPGAVEAAAASMDATIISSEPVEAIIEDDEDDFSFDLDEELELDEELGLGEELELDEELGLGEELELDEELGLGEELELDEELDLGEELELDEELDLGAELELNDELGTGEELEEDLVLEDGLAADEGLILDEALDADTEVNVQEQTLEIDGIDTALDEDLDLTLDEEDGLLLDAESIDPELASDANEDDIELEFDDEDLISIDDDEEVILDLDEEDEFELEEDEEDDGELSLDLEEDDGELSLDLEEDDGEL